jgi:hypothetical protein
MVLSAFLKIGGHEKLYASLIRCLIKKHSTFVGSLRTGKGNSEKSHRSRGTVSSGPEYR